MAENDKPPDSVYNAQGRRLGALFRSPQARSDTHHGYGRLPPDLRRSSTGTDLGAMQSRQLPRTASSVFTQYDMKSATESSSNSQTLQAASSVPVESAGFSSRFVTFFFKQPISPQVNSCTSSNSDDSGVTKNIADKTLAGNKQSRLFKDLNHMAPSSL